MKTFAFALLAALTGGCAPDAAPASPDASKVQATAPVKIGTTPGGSVLYLDPESVKDRPAPAPGAAMVREAIIITDNAAFAATTDDPAAQVSSRNTVEVRCATGEMRIARFTATQKDGRAVSAIYSEDQFAFARPPEGRFENMIVAAVCEQ